MTRSSEMELKTSREDKSLPTWLSSSGKQTDVEAKRSQKIR